MRSSYNSTHVLKKYIHNWERLRRALHDAADNYLDIFNKSTSSRKNGLFHGKKGKNRAINLLTMTEFDLPPDSLLKILAALNQTSSTDLLYIIASHFFKIDDNTRPHPFFTDAFTKILSTCCIHTDETRNRFLSLRAFQSIMHSLLAAFDPDVINALKRDAKVLKETIEAPPHTSSLYEIEMETFVPRHP